MALRTKVDSIRFEFQKEDPHIIVHVAFTDVKGKKHGVSMSSYQFEKELKKCDLNAEYEFISQENTNNGYFFLGLN